VGNADLIVGRRIGGDLSLGRGRYPIVPERRLEQLHVRRRRVLDQHLEVMLGQVLRVSRQRQRRKRRRSRQKLDSHVPLHCRQFRKLGSHIAMPGNATISPIIRNSVTMNGSVPTITSLRSPRSRMPCTTNRFIPTGGVSSAASISSTTRM